eukprot:gene38721-47077_t
MADIVLHSFLAASETDESSGEASMRVVQAIRYSPERVFIKEINLTSVIDSCYLAELSKLPDFNQIPAPGKAVLTALIRFVRCKLYPANYRLNNVALWDIIFLQSLHSHLLCGVADAAAPRVIGRWLDFNRSDNIAQLCQSSSMAVDAIHAGNLDAFKVLVLTEQRRTTGFALQRLPDLSGWTFLHLLASCSHLTDETTASFVQIMLSDGANVNAVDYAGCTALHVACEHFHLNAVLLLAEHPLACVTTKNARGQTPLHLFLGQLKSNRSVLDYQQLVRAVQALTPYEDYTALLQSCSPRTFQPGLLRGLLHSSREV